MLIKVGRSIPKLLYDIAVNIRDNYNNIEWFVSENGMGVSSEERFMDKNGVVCDDYRIEFMKSILKLCIVGSKQALTVMVTLFGRGSTVGHGRMPTAIAMV